MNGFKKFVLQGNLVDLAVAVIIGTAFGAVVQTFTNWLTGLLPDTDSNIFSNKENTFGAFLNATLSFLILAAVVYFFVVLPYTKARERFFPAEEATVADDIVLLTQIRDSLQSRPLI